MTRCIVGKAIVIRRWTTRKSIPRRRIDSFVARLYVVRLRFSHVRTRERLSPMSRSRRAADGHFYLRARTRDPLRDPVAGPAGAVNEGDRRRAACRRAPLQEGVQVHLDPRHHGGERLERVRRAKAVGERRTGIWAHRGRHRGAASGRRAGEARHERRRERRLNTVRRRRVRLQAAAAAAAAAAAKTTSGSPGVGRAGRSDCVETLDTLARWSPAAAPRTGTSTGRPRRCRQSPAEAPGDSTR